MGSNPIRDVNLCYIVTHLWRFRTWCVDEDYITHAFAFVCTILFFFLSSSACSTRSRAAFNKWTCDILQRINKWIRDIQLYTEISTTKLQQLCSMDHGKDNVLKNSETFAVLRGHCFSHILKRARFYKIKFGCRCNQSILTGLFYLFFLKCVYPESTKYICQLPLSYENVSWMINYKDWNSFYWAQCIMIILWYALVSRVYPNQTAYVGAVWSVSTMFPKLPKGVTSAEWVNHYLIVVNFTTFDKSRPRWDSSCRSFLLRVYYSFPFKMMYKV